METRQRAPSRDNRKAHILVEATRIMAECGYFGFGLQELATRCDMTKPGILHHFGSKENLLIEVLRERDLLDQKAVTEILQEAERNGHHQTLTFDEAMFSLHAIAARNVTQPELVRLYAMLRAEALNPAHPAHGYFVAREAYAIDQFAAMFAPFVDAPQELGRELSAMIGGLELQWLRSDQGFDLAAALDRAARKLVQRTR